jgi:PAS domain S-box-containing protein
LQLAAWPFLRPCAWFFVFPAVFFSSEIAGLAGGLIAIAISTPLVAWFFLPPERSFALANASSYYSIGVFVVMGVLFGHVQERLKKASRRANEALEAAHSANEQLRVANGKATRLHEKTREIDAMKTRFFAGVTHALRAPLALILGPVAARLASGDLDEPTRRDLLVVERNARLLDRHVNDLLDVTQLDAGRMPMHYAQVDLAALARFVASHFEVLAEEKRVHFTVDAFMAVPAEVDAGKCQRILLNLLSSAFKFTPDGGSIALSLRKDGNRAELHVQDSGPGTPPDLRKAIFERFQQLESGEGRRPDGLGLGLAIAKEFVDLHGGAIEASEAPGGGVLFAFTLPLKAPAGAAIHAMPSSLDAVLDRQALDELRALRHGSLSSEAIVPTDAPRILVVEDNPDMNLFVTSALRRRYRVDAAFDGQEGLRKALENRPDLIVSDMIMPRMDGERMVEALRCHREMDDVPIVMLTVKDDDAPRVKLLKGGAQDYIGKPFSVDELLARIDGLVAKRRQAKEQLRESEERYRAALDGLLEGFQVIGRDWRYLYVNDALAAQARRTKDELLGHAMMDVYPGIEKTAMFVALQRCMDERVPRQMENELIVPDGTKTWLELSIQPVPEGVLVLSLDVSERKHAENRIGRLNRVLRAIRNVNQLIVRETSSERLIQAGCRLLVEHHGYATALIALTDKNGRCVAHAEAGMDKAGASLAEKLDRGELPGCFEKARQADADVMTTNPAEFCVGCPIAQFCPSMDMLCARLAYGGIAFGYLGVAMEPAIGADAEEQELFAEMAGDLAYALRAMRTENARARAEKDRGLCWAADRSELKSARARAEKDRESLEGLEGQLLQSQKMEAVGRLAGGVAHDFNNMLAVIIGHADMILEAAASNTPLRASIVEIQKAAQRSADLTRQLLAFARKQTIAPQALDLNAIVAGMLKMLGRLIGEDIDLLWKPGKDVWPVKMDPTQLDQILANLVVNARDAISGVGKITIETDSAEFDEAFCANHADFMPGQHVLLSVSDDGCGMDKKTLAMIFEPFFTTKPQERGTGLGLATVYGIVKQNDGFIDVYSEPGQGTTFKIYLPRHEAAAAAEPVVEPNAVPAQSGTETVLLVEDEAALLALSQRLLEQLGYVVLAAGSPIKAIQLAEGYPDAIHLLITDVVMPEMSGRDLWLRLGALRPGLKCLFMSGYTSNIIAHRGVLDEGVHFIQKPFSVENLAKKARKALAG